MSTDYFSAKVTIPLTIDRKQLIDHLLYSGADQYPWWSQIDIDPADQSHDTLLLEVEDPDDEMGMPLTFRVPLQKAAEMLLEEFGGRSGNIIYSEGVDIDIDADDADYLLQKLVFGKQVYS